MSEPSEEQIRAFEEQLKQLRVEDVIVQTLVTMVNIGARRLGLTGEPDSKDLGQAQLAIEGARALMPLVPGDELGPIRDALSQLQMAFTREAQGAPEPPADAPAPPPGGEQAVPPTGSQAPPTPPQAPPTGQPDQATEEAERAKARSKIWTPPGT